MIDQTSTWEFCTFSWENVQRKVEQDWKMVYLSRAEDTNTAQIEWKFDFSKENLKIQNISLVFDSSLYENGEIDLEFISGGKYMSFIINLIFFFHYNQFSVYRANIQNNTRVEWQQ